MAPTVVRVGDEIHYINPEPTRTGLDHPRVRVHRIEAPEPWIVRLRAAVADWTIGDFEADPYLVGVMDRLDPDQRDVVPLLHARACILNANRVRPKGATQAAEWRDALRSMLGEEVPPAMLRVSRDERTSLAGAFLSLSPVGRVASERVEFDTATADRLRHAPAPISTVPFDRATPILLATPRTDNWGYHGSRPTRLVLPHGFESTFDEDWLDAFDAFQSGAPFSGLATNSLDIRPVKESWPWEAADALLADIWLALRASVDDAPAVRSAGGRVVMSLGAGLAAEIVATATTGNVGPVRAMLDCQYPSTGTGMYLTRPIAAGVDSVHYIVPLGVILLGNRVRVQVRFVASPLLLGHGNSAGRAVAMQAAHSATAEAARRAAEDDYDD
jgi:hypothetical protein